MEKKNSYTQKFFGIFLILASLGATFFLYQEDLNLEQKTPKIKNTRKNTSINKSPLQNIWEQDIKKMIEEKVFPADISSLKKVRVFFLDEDLHKYLKNLHTPFKFGDNGENILEVSFMSHHSENDNNDKVIVQYNLTDNKTKNMFWEYSRTLKLDF